MDLLDGNPLFDFFAPTPKTMLVSVRRPRLMRSWAFNTLADEPPTEPNPAEFIHGTARLKDGDSLTVIGSKQEPGRSLRLHLKSFESWDALKTEWSEQIESYGSPLRDMEEEANTDDEKRRLQYMRNVYRKFDMIPPTAWIGFMEANREYGIEEKWLTDCKIPRATFEELAADIRSGHCHDLVLGIEMAAHLGNDAYSLRNDPVTFGIFKLGTLDSGAAHGWLRSITWRQNPLDARSVGKKPADEFSMLQSDDFSEAESLSEVTSPATAIEENFTTMSGQISALAQSTRRGFLFVLAILFVAVLIRLL